LKRGVAVANGRTLAGSGPLSLRLRVFERHLARVLPPAGTRPAPLHAALRYAALSPGKRLRPLLALTACEAVGGTWRRALPAAAAVECAHAFSLVHDDLPAMDDDDYRRGRLTTHKKFGEAIGVLAGDALLALAFEELARSVERGVSADGVVRAVHTLATACGSRELVGGQALDLAAEGRPVTAASVRDIHRRKTGALLGASLVLGGIAGSGDAATLRRLDRLGRDLGLAFQIHDDLLNRDATLARLGKRGGTDAARGKATFPRAVGEDRARREAERLFGTALDAIQTFGRPGRLLETLVRQVASRDR
jgi:geranylgeranyl pyrophosphate synthase